MRVTTATILFTGLASVQVSSFIPGCLEGG